MDKALGVLIANERVPRPAPAPRLKLLVQWESRRRVFLDNLADLLLSRRVPPIALTSRPARFWDDVFVPSGAAWSAFVESMLWHLLLIVLFVWGQSRVWTSVQLFPKRHVVHQPITYYPPARSFPAAGGRAPGAPARSKMTHAQQPAHQAAMPVTPQQKPRIVTPPDIKQATARLPNLPGSHDVSPMVPFSATSNLRRNAEAGPSGVVAPAPQVDQTTTRRLALPRGSPIAPAPDLGESFAERTGNVPNSSGSRVVPPPPAVQSAGHSGRGERSNSLSEAGPSVVPPPPSVRDARNAADARLGSLDVAGAQVVPPAPSVQGAGNSARAGRLSSLSATGPNAVPPPPVVGAGKAARDARPGSMSGTGSQVVPPAPTVEGASKSGAGGRLSSLSGDGAQIVPPPPAVEGGGNSGARASLGSLSEDGSQIAPPPASSSWPARTRSAAADSSSGWRDCATTFPPGTTPKSRAGPETGCPTAAPRR